MRSIIIFLFVLLPAIAFSQQESFKISGYIKDSTTGETLPAASITIKEANTSIISNDEGYFSIKLPKGEYTLQVTYLGYKVMEKKVNVASDITINFDMPEESEEVEEVEVKDIRANENVESTKMSTIKLDAEQIKKLPALFGEVDVIKNIQMLPGVQVAGEGNTGLYVRGGSTDQNLVLMDDAPVYNPTHILGIFSVFSSEPLKSAELYKGGIPAQYGGRLSSVLDVRTREGDYTKIKGSGGIGILASRLAIEGPIIKDKLSFIVSARRAWWDVFAKLLPSPNNKDAAHFEDFNAKLSYKINAKNKLSLSGYYGRDIFNFQNKFGINWGNATGTLKWEHSFNDKLISTTTATYSNFNINLFVKGSSSALKLGSGLSETTVREDFTYFLNSNNELSFGASGSYYSFNPGSLAPGSGDSLFTSFKIDKYHALGETIYLGNKQKLSKRTTLEYGLRYSLFSDVGGVVYGYQNNNADAGVITDTMHYKSLQASKTYGNFEPRLSGRYSLNESSSIKASYNRMVQYLNQMSNSTSPLPFAIWAPASPYITPQKADQVALGFFRNLKENMFEASVETYYKKMYDVVDFKDNAQLLLNPHIETEVRQGKSWAYGAEFYVKKAKGKTTGWISYTWSKTQRQINGINNGNVYYANYDRRNNLNIVFSHDFNDRINFSANFVYGSGRPMTLPAGKYQVDYVVAAYYTQRNGYRMPAYDRLDVALNVKSRVVEGRKWESSWSFGIYNLYNRKNPFAIYVEQEPNGKEQAKMIYLFPILPSVTYNFKF